MAGFLLDTHTLLWYLKGSPELPTPLRLQLETGLVRPLVSVASWWEITIKFSLNKLTLPYALPATYEQALADGFRELPIRPEHLFTLNGLPQHHRDPFDRLLAAQALTDDLTLVSRDPKLDAYGVRRLW